LDWASVFVVFEEIVHGNAVKYASALELEKAVLEIMDPNPDSDSEQKPSGIK